MMKLPELTDTTKTRLVVSIMLFFISFSVYIYGFKYVASGDTVASEILAISLINEGNFDFDEFFEEDEELQYSFARFDGRILNRYSVVAGMMNIPVFLVAELLGINIEEELLPLNVVSMSLLAALSTLLMFFILLKRKFSITLSTLLSLIFAFGTLVWSVTSKGTWQHGPSIFFLSAGMLLFFNEKKHIFAWSGFFFALMCVNRPVNGLIVIPFYVYILFYKRKQFLVMFLTSLIPLIFLAWYSLEYWGSILSLGQGQSGKFTSTPWTGIPGLLFSPARGLLIFTPVFIFSMLYMIKDVFVKGGNVLYRFLCVGFVLTLAIYTIWERWFAGHCFGYRYLSEYIPILILFLAEAWKKYIKPKTWTRILFLFLIVFSVYFNFLGAFIYPSDFNTSPNNIDFNEYRIWTIKDTELLRLNSMFFEKLSNKL